MRLLSFFRPRYSLRALLVLMTALALFLGYHLNWIRARNDLIKTGAITAEIAPRDRFWHPKKAPGFLSLFGEPAYDNVGTNTSRHDVDTSKVKSLFPEALHHRYHPRTAEDDEGKLELSS